MGPIGVLCIRRTLAEGRWYGFVSGMGAATADAFYGSLAAFGLTALTTLLVDYADVLRLVGGGFLVYLGLRTLLAKPAAEAAAIQPRRAGLWGAYLSTLGLTLTNPMTILAFLSIFAGLGSTTGTPDAAAGVVMVAGVFAGSALWWLTLSGLVSLVRQRLKPHHLRAVNIVSGLLILAFALVILGELLA